jgi:hypothetical protein
LVVRIVGSVARIATISIVVIVVVVVVVVDSGAATRRGRCHRGHIVCCTSSGTQECATTVYQLRDRSQRIQKRLSHRPQTLPSAKPHWHTTHASQSHLKVDFFGQTRETRSEQRQQSHFLAMSLSTTNRSLFCMLFSRLLLLYLWRWLW